MTDSSNPPIRLGLMPPLTGLVHIYGQEISWAARIAVDQINRAGGLLGRPLELIIEDDGSLPETAVPAARRLVEEHGCSAIIGNLLSNSRIAVADRVAEPLRVPYLNFSFYEGSIAGHYFFHFAALPNQQIQRMIPSMAERFGPKMYFAGNNYEWPRGSIDAAKRALLEIGGDVVGEEYLPIGVKPEEIDWLLRDLARSGADVFVPYFAGLDQINLLNRFTERGLKARMAVVMGHYDEVMVSHLAPEVRSGLYSSNSYFMSVDTPANQDYLRQLAALPEVDGLWPEGNGVLTNFGEGTFVCVKAFAAAVEQAGSTAADDLVSALERVRVQAPQGQVCMDAATHHAQVNSYLSRCEADGRFRIVESYGAIPPQIPERYREHFRRKLAYQATDQAPAGSDLIPREQLQTSFRNEGARAILSIADMAVIATDASGRINEANTGACELFGYGHDELIGLSVHQLVPPQFRARHEEHLRQFIAGDEMQRRMSQRGEISGYRKDGTYVPIEASIAKIQTDSDWMLVATVRDLSHLKQAREELAWKATHDSLTGLPNRTLIMKRLGHALERSRRHQASLALLFIDLDGFKEVNDTFGHEAGDHLLQTIAQRLLEAVRPGDTVARLAGDEFVALCEGLEEPGSISLIAERLSEASRRMVSFNDATLSVSASIGIAVGHGTTHSAEDLLRNADTAMYAVKQKGRDGWKFFSQMVQQEAGQRLEIITGLRLALERDEFHILLQPIVGSDNGVVQGAEVLLRWTSANGEIAPGLFIPVAESNNLIIEIGNWVFEQACRVEQRLRERFGERAPYISVNLSTRQMLDERLVEHFQAILQRTGANPQNLLLEITETSLMADVTSNRVILERFVDMGIRLAVDDFGTGYSSLAQLLHLKAHALKVDQTFIQQIDESAEKQVVVAAISRMGRALNMTLVAEGVETSIQRDLVRAYGIRSIQGYFFHRPMNEAALVDLLESPEQALQLGNEPLHYLVYASKPAPGLSTSEFRNIADKAVNANRRIGVTGYLVLMDDVCLQYLEGPEVKIKGLFERIAQDPRHSEVKLIAEGEIDERLFMDWNMGFHRVDTSLLKSATRLHYARGDAYQCYSNNPAICCSLFEAISARPY